MENATHPVFGLLEKASELLVEAAAYAVGTFTDDEVTALLSHTEEAGRLIDSMRIASAAEMGERSRYELGDEGLSFKLGHRKPQHAIEALARVSEAEAFRRMRLGKAVAPRQVSPGVFLPPTYPVVSAAVQSGRLGVESAGHILKALDISAPHADNADLAEAESQLVFESQYVGADSIKVQASVWVAALDPDGAEPRDEDVRSRRGFWQSRSKAGMTKNVWMTGPVETARINEILIEADKASIPRFLSEEDMAKGSTTTPLDDGSGDERVEFVADPRTRAQRHSDVIFGMLGAGMRASADETGGVRSTTTVLAVATVADLEAGIGTGWIDTAEEPVSIQTIKELACSDGYQTILLGSFGEVLYLGKKPRLFSPAQARALAVRDGGCCWPGCTEPPRRCEPHHVIEHQHGGPTDINNGMLFCEAHHHMLHRSAFTVKMIEGRPALIAPPWLDPKQELQPLGKSRIQLTTSVRSRLNSRRRT